VWTLCDKQVQRSEQPTGDAWMVSQVIAAEQHMLKAHLLDKALLKGSAPHPSLSQQLTAMAQQEQISSRQPVKQLEHELENAMQAQEQIQLLKQLEQELDDEEKRFDATVEEFKLFRNGSQQKIHRLCEAMVMHIPRLKKMSPEQLESQADVILKLLHTL